MINRIAVKTYNVLVVVNLIAVFSDIVSALGKHIQ